MQGRRSADLSGFSITARGLPAEARKARRPERVKGTEPSSSAWKIAGKLNDLNEFCVKPQPKNRL
jgi:hypothetical protein